MRPLDVSLQAFGSHGTVFALAVNCIARSGFAFTR